MLDKHYRIEPSKPVERIKPISKELAKIISSIYKDVTYHLGLIEQNNDFHRKVWREILENNLASMSLEDIRSLINRELDNKTKGGGNKGKKQREQKREQKRDKRKKKKIKRKLEEKPPISKKLTKQTWGSRSIPASLR